MLTDERLVELQAAIDDILETHVASFDLAERERPGDSWNQCSGCDANTRPQAGQLCSECPDGTLETIAPYLLGCPSCSALVELAGEYQAHCEALEKQRPWTDADARRIADNLLADHAPEAYLRSEWIEGDDPYELGCSSHEDLEDWPCAEWRAAWFLFCKLEAERAD